MRESLGPCCAPYCKKFTSKILNPGLPPCVALYGQKQKPKCVDPRGEPSIGAAARKDPLVIVWHDHDNSKEDHAFQAMHLASWGMHGLALDLPNRGPWIASGRTLARLIDAIHRTPQLVEAMQIGAIAWCRHASRFRKEKMRVMEERQTHQGGRQR